MPEDALVHWALIKGLALGIGASRESILKAIDRMADRFRIVDNLNGQFALYEEVY